MTAHERVSPAIRMTTSTVATRIGYLYEKTTSFQSSSPVVPRTKMRMESPEKTSTNLPIS
jgi:hypothetical protein